jgi:hypothetical protein
MATFVGNFIIRSGSLVLDVAGSSIGAPVISWRRHGGLNQIWQFSPTHDPSGVRTFVIKNLCARGAVLSVSASGDIVAAASHGGHDQQWRVEPQAAQPGSFRVCSAQSGAVIQSGSTEGAPARLVPFRGCDSQLWYLERIEVGAVVPELSQSLPRHNSCFAKTSAGNLTHTRDRGHNSKRHWWRDGLGLASQRLCQPRSEGRAANHVAQPRTRQSNLAHLAIRDRWLVSHPELC